jgi:hypothetical protein
MVPRYLIRHATLRHVTGHAEKSSVLEIFNGDRPQPLLCARTTKVSRTDSPLPQDLDDPLNCLTKRRDTAKEQCEDGRVAFDYARPKFLIGD